MSALDIAAKGIAAAKAAKAAKRAEPFYSAVDEAAKALTRGKGTGKEFMVEVLKKPGVKPTEIKERGLQKLEALPKMTKEEFLQKLEENPAPKVEEKVLTTPNEREIEERAYELAHNESREMARIRGYRGGDVDDVADEMAEDIMNGSDRDEYMQRAQEELYDEGYTAQHGEYALPGGENYREILLKMPGFKDQQKLMELEAMRRRVDPNINNYRYDELTKQIEELKAKRAAMPEQFEGVSHHFKGEPGILASIRVSDRIVPTYTKQQAEEIGQRIADSRGVASHKNLGNGAIEPAIRAGVVTPKEAAQYADFRGFQGVDTTGAKQKVLHIEEIQSDWHQHGRDLRNAEIKRLMRDEGLSKKEASAKVPEDFGYRTKMTPEEQAEMKALRDKHYEEDGLLEGDMARLRQLEAKEGKVPDAPFKKNWHELALKRMLNYAAENGYDRIAITPGSAQADRYSLAKQVSSVMFYTEPGSSTGVLRALDLEGRPVIKQTIPVDKLEDYIGKEAASKILSQTPVPNEKTGLPSELRTLNGVDLEIGGEGMRGFYDKMIPSYLNDYGKKYGVSVGTMDVTAPPKDSMSVIDYPRGEEYTQGRINWNEFLQANPEAGQKFTAKLHSFDITPEMREEITTKGMPLYQQIGIPAGGAAAGAAALEGQEDQGYADGGAVKAPVGSEYDTDPDMEDGGRVIQSTAFKKGGRVHLSQNPDTMLLDLLSKS
jgi:hypothetical protein